MPKIIIKKKEIEDENIISIYCAKGITSKKQNKKNIKAARLRTILLFIII